MAWGLAAGLLAACGPDLGKPEGALGLLAQGCANGDAEAVFLAIDERSRFALDGIVQARNEARSLVSASYPTEAQAEALAQLGDAAESRSGAELFARRCDRSCIARLCQGVGAPASLVRDGGLAAVRTVRGADKQLYREKEHYGLIWQTESLARERRRAFAELSTIKANAKVYAQQKSLR